MIDDDEDEFLIVRSMLKEARGRKFDIHWESTYAGGRNQLFSNAYHAVLVDYDLGLKSGIELIREATAQGYSAPLILFTGRGSYEVDLEAMEAGATLYLSKGEATPLLLERIIRYAVELKQKEHSLRTSEAQLRAREIEHQQAEKALLKAEERFAKAFHSSPAGLAITRASDGHFIEVNESLCRLTGYARQEIIGHSALELDIYANPDQRAELLGLINQQGHVLEYEVEVRTKTGGRRIVLGSYDQIELDHETCLLATLIDITERKRAEAALLSNTEAQMMRESRLREFLENTHDSYFALDQAWRITDTNRRFAEVMGKPAEAMIGENFWALFPRYLGTAVEQNYRKVMAERVPINFRQEGIYTNNIYDISAYPTGEGIAVFSMDRTKEYRQQQLLENERARLEAVLSALPVEVWITDSEGRIVGKNQQSDQTWAGDARLSESWEKYAVYELLDPASQTPRPLEEYPLVQVLRTGQPVAPQENLIRRPDGSHRFALVSAAPIKDHQGQLTGAVAIMLDIHQQKQAERSLHQKKELLYTIIDNAQAAIYAKDLQGRYILSNRHHAALYGQAPEMMKGKTDADFASTALRAAEYRHHDQLVAERGQPVEFEEVAPGLDGSPRTYLSIKFPLRDLNGNIYAVCGISTDITERKQAEQALEDREAALHVYTRELEAILDAVPAYMWITHDPHGQHMIGNAAVYDLLGIQPGENLSMSGAEALKMGHFTVLHNGVEVTGDQLPVQQVARSGVALRNYEADMVLEDGVTRHLLGNVSPLLDDNGQPAGAVSAFLDITDMKTFQRKLQENENRFRVALASAPITVYTTDCDLRITWMHDHHPEFDAQRVIGQRLDEILPGEYGKILIDIQQAVLQSGQPQQGEIETWVDDQPFHYAYHIDPIRSDTGEFSGVACAGFEVTRRREAEKALLEREEMLELALASANAGVWTWILRTNTVIWSDEFYRIYGFAPGEVEASLLAVVERIHPEDRPVVQAVVEKAIAQGKKMELVHRVVWPDGSLHWIHTLSRVFYDSHGKPERMTGIVLDVTQQKQEEEMLARYAAQLAHSNQALEQFAFVASHDLQEPLRKIIQFGNGLQQQAQHVLDETSVEYLDRIRSAADRMQTMIEGLLELSRVNRQGREFQPVDLSQVVVDVVSDLESRIKAAHGHVEVHPLPVILADEVQMRQLFQNLLGNAIKFHQPGLAPLVQVESVIDPAQQPAVVEIRVRDNGIGFDPQQAERIFQPFQRLHGRNEYEGSGLGLSICQKIVERHHGRIWAHSQPGKGTTFIIQLPAELVQSGGKPGRMA